MSSRMGTYVKLHLKCSPNAGNHDQKNEPLTVSPVANTNTQFDSGVLQLHCHSTQASGVVNNTKCSLRVPCRVV